MQGDGWRGNAASYFTPKVSNLLSRASEFARDSVSSALESTLETIEYDETGRVIEADEQPARGEPVPADELQALRQQFARMLDESEQRREAAEARARASLAREQEAEQRVLAAEVEQTEAITARRAAESALAAAQSSAADAAAALDAHKRDEASSALSVSSAVASAVEAEAERWRGELSDAQSRLEAAMRAREKLEQEVEDMGLAWQADQDAWQQQRQQREEGGAAGGSEKTAAAEEEAAQVQLAERAAAAAKEEAAASREAARAALSERDAAIASCAATEVSLAEARVSIACLLSGLQEQEGEVVKAEEVARVAIHERECMQAQAQRGVDAASEQLLSATREAGRHVIEAEGKAAALMKELEEMREALRVHNGEAAAAKEAEVGRRAAHEAALEAATLERDAAVAAEQKVRTELASLRLHLLESEDNSTYRESELVGRTQALEAMAVDAGRERAAMEEAAKAAEARANTAEWALSTAQKRATEQSTALSNLQSLLESMHGGGSGGGGGGTVGEAEACELRVCGRLLSTELTLMEWEGERLHAVCEELSGGIEAANRQNVTLTEELQRLHALLQSAQAAQAEDKSIDKRLVCAVLIKVVEQRCSKDVLIVLASMLGCTEEEERALGLRPAAGRHGGGPVTDGAKLSDMWRDFLVAEAEGQR